MKVLTLLVVILPFTFLIFYWCHLTNSLGKPIECIHSLTLHTEYYDVYTNTHT